MQRLLWRGLASACAAVVLAACTQTVQPGGESADPAAESATAAADAAARLDAVLADPRRDGDRARDGWRHPKETLAFFGVAPDMTVAEVYPGGGWYARILAPYVGAEGGYLAVDYSRTTHERLAGARSAASISSAPATLAAQYADTVRGYAGADANILGGVAFDDLPEALYGSVDAVLFVRSLHNFERTRTLNGALAETYALMRPGGVVGVVQHRAPAGAPDLYVNGSKGYMREDDVIAAFVRAGFMFEEASEINANPADPANWVNGVWTLPPELGLGELDRDEYEAIGESDRMTLRFRKPAG